MPLFVFADQPMSLELDTSTTLLEIENDSPQRIEFLVAEGDVSLAVPYVVTPNTTATFSLAGNAWLFGFQGEEGRIRYLPKTKAIRVEAGYKEKLSFRMVEGQLTFTKQSGNIINLVWTPSK